MLMILNLMLAALLSCDPALAALFAPRQPRIGSYEVCTTPEPLSRATPAGWTMGAPENIDPLDAFGAAGSYDRSALARLYGGARARVVHGWRREGGRFESVTLISPFPDATLTHLRTGTMLIHFTLLRN